MSHLGPHTSMRPHFSHAPKIGAGKQSACHCVHQVLQEEIGSFGPFTPVSAIFFIAVLFLMVSINICRVISTFITRAVFLPDGISKSMHLLFEAAVQGIMGAHGYSVQWLTLIRWYDYPLVRNDWQTLLVVPRGKCASACLQAQNVCAHCHLTTWKFITSVCFSNYGAS